jgi:hypothetical protein
MNHNNGSHNRVGTPTGHPPHPPQQYRHQHQPIPLHAHSNTHHPNTPSYPPYPHANHISGGGGGSGSAPRRRSPYTTSTSSQNDVGIIVVHDFDVLSGRGVNIAQHRGNERFRALVQSRYDDDYCASYTTLEKRAVAEEIIHLIRSSAGAVNQDTTPPQGRFLKRTGRANNARGLQGPWEELTGREAIKKTCQALRDCNRQDRTGYAAAVNVPEDVRYNQELRSKMGLSNKEYAEQMAQAARLEVAQQQQHQDEQQQRQQEQQDQQRQQMSVTSAAFMAGGTTITIMQESTAAQKRSRSDVISPSVEHAAEWLTKKQRPSYHADSMTTPPLPSITPTTAASSGQRGYPDAASLMDSFDHDTSSPEDSGSMNIPGLHQLHHHHHDMPSSPAAAGFHTVHMDPGVAGGVGQVVSYADTFDPMPREEYHEHHLQQQEHLHHLQQQAHHHPLNHQQHDHHSIIMSRHQHVMNCNDMDPLQIAAEAAAAIQDHDDVDDSHHLQATGVDEGYPPPSPFNSDHHGGLTDDDDGL